MKRQIEAEGKKKPFTKNELKDIQELRIS